MINSAACVPLLSPRDTKLAPDLASLPSAATMSLPLTATPVEVKVIGAERPPVSKSLMVSSAALTPGPLRALFLSARLRASHITIIETQFWMYGSILMPIASKMPTDMAMSTPPPSAIST